VKPWLHKKQKAKSKKQKAKSKKQEAKSDEPVFAQKRTNGYGTNPKIFSKYIKIFFQFFAI
jgi:hypothetical protein